MEVKSTTENSSLLGRTEQTTTGSSKKIKYALSVLSLLTIGVLLSYFMVNDADKKKLSLKLRYALSDENTDDFEFYSDGFDAEFDEMTSDDTVFGEYDAAETMISADEINMNDDELPYEELGKEVLEAEISENDEDSENLVPETDDYAEDDLVEETDDFVPETDDDFFAFKTDGVETDEEDPYANIDLTGDLSEIDAEYVTRPPLRVGSGLALKYLKETRWASCWTSRCDLRTCPGQEMVGSDWEGCAGEVFQIYARNRNVGDLVRNCDPVMLYYTQSDKWLGCPNINQCDWRTCPGDSYPPSAAKYSQCWGEVFQIFARGKTCGAVIIGGDQLMFRYPRANRWVTFTSGKVRALATCPGPNAIGNSPKWNSCWGEVVQLFVKPVSRSVLWVGKTIALKYLSNGRWASCWESRCDLRTCPGGFMQGDNWSRCAGEVFQIFAKGKSWRQPIKNCEDVMLYYYNKQKWLGCPNINQCDWRTCPGGRIPSITKYAQCWGEVFTIYARGKQCGAILVDDDQIMLNYKKGGDRWVTGASRDNKLRATATCPNVQKAAPPKGLPNYVPFYRYWVPAPRSDHFYTTNANEIGTTTPGKIGRFGYKSEGIACYISRTPGTGLVPLYRYWLASRSNHFYTTNAAEIGTTTPGRVGKYGYKSEGIAGYVYKTRVATSIGGPDLIPLFRYYQGAVVDHFYTANAREIGTTTPGRVGRYGYRAEGIVGWCSRTGKRPPPPPSTGVVSPADWTRCWGEVFQLATPTQTRRILVGSTVAFKYNKAGRFASCWESKCDLRTCPGGAMTESDWKKCAGEVFEIYAFNKRRGQPILNGDRVMIYYPYKKQWLGCPNINQCDWRTCPGSSLGNGPPTAKYSQCWGEVFTIFARFKVGGETINELDRIMLRYNRGSRWVTGASAFKIKALATCPGNDGPGINSVDWDRCWGEVFEIFLK